MVKASDWLHCPFDSPTLPSKKTVRMRQQGKAVGCRTADGFAVSRRAIPQSALRLCCGFASPLSLLYIRCRLRL
jgi:hypothetical protein